MELDCAKYLIEIAVQASLNQVLWRMSTEAGKAVLLKSLSGCVAFGLNLGRSVIGPMLIPFDPAIRAAFKAITSCVAKF